SARRSSGGALNCACTAAMSALLSFPRRAWERCPGRSASRVCGPPTGALPTRRRASGEGVPTQSVGTRGRGGAARCSFARYINLVEDPALGEELVLGLVPIASAGRDREQLDFGQCGRVFLQDLRVDRAVIVLGDDRLGLVGVEELEVGLGGRPR